MNVPSKPSKMPTIIVPYSDGDIIFKIVGDLDITDKIDLALADHPNIRFRYMWNTTKVDQYLRKIKKRLSNFKSRVCSYWAKYILEAEGNDPRKITSSMIESMILRAWSDDVAGQDVPDDDMQEYIDLAISGRYSDSKKRMSDKLRLKVQDEMYPYIEDKDSNMIWFRGMETEEAHIEKWESIKQDLDICIECLGDKGYALGNLRHLKIEGMMDLYSARSRLKQQSEEKFKKKDN